MEKLDALKEELRNVVQNVIEADFPPHKLLIFVDDAIRDWYRLKAKEKKNIQVLCWSCGADYVDENFVEPVDEPPTCLYCEGKISWNEIR